MDHKEILTGVLVKTLKLTTEKVGELLENPDGDVLTEILNLDKARIADLGKEKFQDGIKKAKKQILSEFESTIRGKYEVEDENLTGEELIESIVSAQIQKAKPADGKGKKGEITEDDIKKHPLFIELEKSKQKEVEAKEEEWKTKYDNLSETHQKEQSFNGIAEKALSILPEKFVLPEDGKLANNQKSWFVKSLQDFDFQKLEDGRTIVLKDGKRIEDEHGHVKELDDFLVEKASDFFPTASNNGGGNAGNGNDDGKGSGSGGGGSKKAPTNEEELVAYMEDDSIPLEDREKAFENFNATE